MGEAEIDWAEVYMAALVLAKKFMPGQDEEDVVTEGITRTLDGRSPWKPESGRTPAAHVFRVGRDAIRARYRKDERHADEGHEADVVHHLGVTQQTTPEEAAAEAERRQKKVELLQQLAQEFAGDPAALDVIACANQAISKAAEQVTATGRGYDEMRNATKRVTRRVEALWSEIESKAGDD